MRSERPSTNSLSIDNRQRFQRLNIGSMVAASEAVLSAMSVGYQIGVALVGSRAMAAANQRYLSHSGSTDVITFDYGSTPKHLIGDILVSVPDAWKHALEFGTTGEQELLRYLIHGFLHLAGHDDRTESLRSLMKADEERWLERFGHLAAGFFVPQRVGSRKQI